MTKVTVISIKIGRNIKKIRMNKNITQENLAFDAKLNRAYIGYIERGERNPSTETLSKISKALKVPLGDLLN